MGNEEIKRVSEELEKLLDIYLDSDRKSSGNPDPEVMSDVWVALGDVSETYFSDMLPVEYVREPARERREPDGLYRQP